jgi:hypothetical protein
MRVEQPSARLLVCILVASAPSSAVAACVAGPNCARESCGDCGPDDNCVYIYGNAFCRCLIIGGSCVPQTNCFYDSQGCIWVDGGRLDCPLRPLPVLRRAAAPPPKKEHPQRTSAQSRRASLS